MFLHFAGSEGCPYCQMYLAKEQRWDKFYVQRFLWNDVELSLTKRDLCLVFLPLEFWELFFQELLNPGWRAFQKPLCPQDPTLKSIWVCFSSFSSTFLVCFIFLCSFFIVPFVISSLFCFVELATIMVESSGQYVVHDIELPKLLRTVIRPIEIPLWLVNS